MPKDRNAEFLLGQHGRGAREAGDVAGAGGHKSGFGAVCAAQAEIDQQLAGRGQHQCAQPWPRSAFENARY